MNHEMIVAYGKNYEIGAQGDLLMRSSADMAHFRAITLGKSVIMGRLTFESLPYGRPLPNRQNIVVSSHNIDADVTVVRTVEDAYDAAQYRPIVIGGGAIYLATLPFTDVIYATEIDGHFPHADTFFPRLGDEWHATSREHQSPDARNPYSMDFVTYERAVDVARPM